MALLDRVRERTGSDLSDSELEAMIVAITADMDARFGPAGAITIEFGDLDDPLSRERRTLRLARVLDPAQAVTILEDEPADSGRALARITLDPADYRVLHGGRTLQRLTGGPNARSHWAPLVTVSYTPLGEQAARDEALIKLMQIDLTYRGGLKMERAGDYHVQIAPDILAEREAVYASLAQRRGMVMA